MSVFEVWEIEIWVYGHNVIRNIESWEMSIDRFIGRKYSFRRIYQLFDFLIFI